MFICSIEWWIVVLSLSNRLNCYNFTHSSSPLRAPSTKGTCVTLRKNIRHDPLDMASMTATTTTLYKYHCPDRLHSESGPDIKSIASPIFNSYSIDQYSPRPDSSTDSRLLACQPTNCDLLTSPSNTTLAVASNNHHHHHHLNTTPVQSSMGDQQHFSMAQSSGKWKESVEQVQNGPIHTLGQLETLARKECIKEIESACNLLQISAGK